MDVESVTVHPDQSWELTDRPGGWKATLLRSALEYAVLAPSSHNTQPWLFCLADDHVDLFADRTRSLPVVDPTDRELIMSCGACLLHLRLALRNLGWTGSVLSFPEPDSPDLLARVGLGEVRPPTPTDEVLFQAIPKRRTNRTPFADLPVSSELLRELSEMATSEGAALHVIIGKGHRRAVAELVADADRLQAADVDFRRELAEWVHPNRSVRKDGLPGSVFGLGDTLSYAGPFALRRFDWGPLQSSHDRRIAMGSPVLAILTTANDTPRDWLRAGQALGRILLRAAADGVMASFLNQPIELRELRPALAKAAEVDGYPQILLRMGFGSTPNPTLRRPVRDVLIFDGEERR